MRESLCVEDVPPPTPSAILAALGQQPWSQEEGRLNPGTVKGLPLRAIQSEAKEDKESRNTRVTLALEVAVVQIRGRGQSVGRKDNINTERREMA
jgi:hypothetical protein